VACREKLKLKRNYIKVSHGRIGERFPLLFSGCEILMIGKHFPCTKKVVEFYTLYKHEKKWNKVEVERNLTQIRTTLIMHLVIKRGSKEKMERSKCIAPKKLSPYSCLEGE
jgi:hypothetical protein